MNNKTMSNTLDIDIDSEKIAAFQAKTHGQLIQPGDPDYDEARSIYNAMIDKHPRFIMKCENIADVIASVNFTRENDLETSIRGGGHNGPGLALVDNGFVIDLSP